jgi:heptosyltransferase II
VTPTAVIQAKRGIGDVIWHLPFVRAIAAASPGGKVTFLAPPSSCAKELLAAEPSVAEVLYFEHHGSELRRGLNLIRLTALLRRNRFDTIWIFERTRRPALASWLAGIPERIGLGLGPQRLFITNAGIDQSHFHDHPIEWLRALMAAMKVLLPSTEPELSVAGDSLAAVREKFRGRHRPWFVIGIGTSDPARDWPDHYWVEFLAGLRRLTRGTFFLIGGPANTPRANDLILRGALAPAVNACDLTLGYAIALLHHADLFVGADSGPMNLAVAVATPAFVLFGVNPVLSYSKFIHAIAPQGGPQPGGMLRITPAHALERVEAYLSGMEAPS